jgi:hypothetical protein
VFYLLVRGRKRKLRMVFLFYLELWSSNNIWLEIYLAIRPELTNQRGSNLSTNP